MTNASLQAALAELGNRLCFIIMDNDRKLRLGYPESPLQSVDQFQYRTWGGEDFFGYSQPSSYPDARMRNVSYTVWHRTESIQQIAAMDENCPDYRIDPFV